MKLAFAAVIAVVAACATSQPAGDDAIPAALRDAAVTAAMGSPHAGDAMPAFTVATLEGATLDSATLRGKPLLLHFTATWCPYCREEIASIVDIAKQSGDRGRVVLVDVKEGAERWRKFGGAASGGALTVALDDDGSVAAKFNPPKARPFLEPAEVPLAGTMLVDADGVVRLYVLAENAKFDPSLADLRAAWTRMLAAPPAPPVPPTPPPLGARAAPALPPLLSEPHADVSTGQLQPGTDGRGAVEVIFDVPAGFHIMSNAPSDPSLIATSVAVSDTRNRDVDAVAWPAPSTIAAGGAQWSVFTGHVVARVPYRVRDAREPTISLDIDWRYQMCDAQRCYRPHEGNTMLARGRSSSSGLHNE